MPRRSYKKKRHSRRTRGGDGDDITEKGRASLAKSGTISQDESDLTPAQLEQKKGFELKMQNDKTRKIAAASTIANALAKRFHANANKRSQAESAPAINLTNKEIFDITQKIITYGKLEKTINKPLENPIMYARYIAAVKILLANCDNDDCAKIQKMQDSINVTYESNKEKINEMYEPTRKKNFNLDDLVEENTKYINEIIVSEAEKAAAPPEPAPIESNSSIDSETEEKVKKIQNYMNTANNNIDYLAAAEIFIDMCRSLDPILAAQIRTKIDEVYNRVWDKYNGKLNSLVADRKSQILKEIGEESTSEPAINLTKREEIFKKVEEYIKSNNLDENYVKYVNGSDVGKPIELEKHAEYIAAYSLLVDNCSQDKCDSIKKDHEGYMAFIKWLIKSSVIVKNGVKIEDFDEFEDDNVRLLNTKLDKLIAEKKNEILKEIEEEPEPSAEPAEPAAAPVPSTSTSTSSYGDSDWITDSAKKQTTPEPSTQDTSYPPEREGDDLSDMININQATSSNPNPEDNGLEIKINVGVANDSESGKPALFLGDVTMASTVYTGTPDEKNRINSQNFGSKIKDAVTTASTSVKNVDLVNRAQQGYNYTDEQRGRDIFDIVEKSASEEFYAKTNKAKEEESQAVTEGNIQDTKERIKKHGVELTKSAERLGSLLKTILDKIDAAIQNENDTKPIDTSITKSVTNINNLKTNYIDKYIEGINSLLGITKTSAFNGVNGISKDEILNEELRQKLHIADTVFNQLTDDNSNNLVVINRLIKAINTIVTTYNNTLESASKFTFEKVEYGVHLSGEYTLQCIPPKTFFGSSKPIQFTGVGDTFIEKFFSSKAVAPFEKPDTLETAMTPTFIGNLTRGFSAELRRSSAERAKWGKEIAARNEYYKKKQEAANKKNFGSDTSTWGKTKKYFGDTKKYLGDTRRKYLGFGNGGRRTRKCKKSRKSRKSKGGKNRRHSRKH